MNIRRRIEVPVDPLAESRWTKLERSLLARWNPEAARSTRAAASTQSAGNRRPLLLWSFAALALGTVAVVMGVRLAGTAAIPIPRSPMKVATGASPRHIAFEGLAVDLGPYSSVAIAEDPATGVLASVERGEAAWDVEPRARWAPFVVRAGNVQVRVVGTRFRVTRILDGARVDVQKGVVEVETEDQSMRLRAGQTWITAPPATLVPSADSPAPPVSPPAEPSPARPVDTNVVKKGPVRLAPSAKVDAGAAEERRGHQDLYESAARLEVHDAPQAINFYRQLESSNDSWAQNALFAHGRLEATRGNHAEARRLLGEYLKRFPRGPNADDARSVLARLP
jgi:hypothetical protein